MANGKQQHRVSLLLYGRKGHQTCDITENPLALYVYESSSACEVLAYDLKQYTASACCLEYMTEPAEVLLKHVLDQVRWEELAAYFLESDRDEVCEHF